MSVGGRAPLLQPIGLSTMAAARGANVVLASRNEEALRQAAASIDEAGGRAISVVADVADPDQVDAIGRAAIDAFGGFDTWVNNAGISIYGKLADVPLAEAC